MWMDCDTCQDTNEGETMSRIHCMGVLCPDKEKYGTLIYTITCETCYRNKMSLFNDNCKCTIIEMCDYCMHDIGIEDDEDHCICKEDYNDSNCPECY